MLQIRRREEGSREGLERDGGGKMELMRDKKKVQGL